MFLRFVTEGHVEDYDLYGAQAESVLGLYDSVRSAVLDITANAVVLEDSSLSCEAALAARAPAEPMQAERLERLVKETAKARAFASQPTKIYIGTGPIKTPTVTPFFEVKIGLESLARRICKETSAFAESIGHVEAEAGMIMRELDSEFNPGLLPPLTGKKKSEIVPVVITQAEIAAAGSAIREPGDDSDLEDIDDFEEEIEEEAPIAPAKGKKRKAS